jgi:hypothetical protein
MKMLPAATATVRIAGNRRLMTSARAAEVQIAQLQPSQRTPEQRKIVWVAQRIGMRPLG